MPEVDVGLLERFRQATHQKWMVTIRLNELDPSLEPVTFIEEALTAHIAFSQAIDKVPMVDHIYVTTIREHSSVVMVKEDEEEVH